MAEKRIASLERRVNKQGENLWTGIGQIQVFDERLSALELKGQEIEEILQTQIQEALSLESEISPEKFQGSNALSASINSKISHIQKQILDSMP